MKKKLTVFMMGILLVTNLTGCGLLPNRTNYDGYTQIQMSNESFYIPENMNASCEGDGSNFVCTDYDTYYIIAQDLKTSVYDEDVEDLCTNLNDYFKNVQVDVSIKANMYTSTEFDNELKVIFNLVEVEGCKGRLAYIAGSNYEAYVLVAGDEDAFEKGVTRKIVKSLEHYDGEDYTTFPITSTEE